MNGDEGVNAKIRSVRRRRLLLFIPLLVAFFVTASHCAQWTEVRFHLDANLAWWGSCALLFLPFVWLGGRLNRSFNPATDAAQVVFHEREGLQRKRLARTYQELFVLAAILFGCLSDTLHPQLLHPAMGDMRWLLLFFALVFVPEIFGRTYSGALRTAMNDELTHFIRARALALGYATVVVAAAITYLGSFYWQRSATVGLPAVLFLAIAVPKVSFAVLERRMDAVG